MCNEEESEARKEAQIWRDKFNNLRDEYASFVQCEIEGREIGTKKVRHLVDALQEENGRLRSTASLHKSNFKKEKRQAAKLMGKLTFCEDKHKGAQKEAQIWKGQFEAMQRSLAASLDAKIKAESERDGMRDSLDSLMWALSKLREENNG